MSDINMSGDTGKHSDSILNSILGNETVRECSFNLMLFAAATSIMMVLYFGLVSKIS